MQGPGVLLPPGPISTYTDKMRKKQLTGTICLCLLTSLMSLPASASAVNGAQDDAAPAIVVIEEEIPAASAQSAAVPESQLAREMIGEERTAGDAAEAARMAQSEAQRKAKQQEKAKAAAENDSHGFAITIIAMLIVIFALVILSILFMIFGQVSSSMQKARKRAAHGVNEDNAADHHDELDSGEVIAAISMALAEHTGQGHDIEDTILTIRKLRKAYSPWNSKIYNMRHMTGPTHEPQNLKGGKTPA